MVFVLTVKQPASNVTTENAVLSAQTENFENLTLEVTSDNSEIFVINNNFAPDLTLETILDNLNSEGELPYQKNISEAGSYITSMNNTVADPNSQFWKIVVNGKDASVGISTLNPENNDKISFVLTNF